MASTDDIAVPDLSYFIEHDLRDAIRQMDERAAPASLPSEATGAIFTPSTGIPSSNAGLSKSYTKNKKKKKEKEPGNGARKFASPYAVFADIRRQELSAISPNKKMGDVWKEMAAEWRQMTRIEKAPFRKEFESRQRLYELENPESTRAKTGRSTRQGDRSQFRFAPYRRNKDFEISKVEHLPHCPIAVKQKVYEESVLKPFVHPRQGELQMGTSKGSTSQARDPCLNCPRVYAVCDYCRGLGHTGPRIFHFESDCWSKSRHLKPQHAAPLYTSPARRRALLGPIFKKTSNISTASPQPTRISTSSASSLTIDLDKLFNADIGAQPEGASGSANAVQATSSQAVDELPDLSIIDAFLASAGLVGNTASSLW